ncbi:s-adenosylmethionine mitochondrial carrier [Plasmopara halstedii]|uniref:S-adenosylmethionine mitochondrial carrier n=1 Tax=Plasmopara halstedii TaxID=4781 RepID=A0A0P1AG14_PLAHL|nr:s-adenosylmethionine mitochondrial carrier [Plasmopara halstedii]CEG40045.1 s-adenosylmethionine mitochondrial carrier [Plasmopara halstedii]|eukprot:XP_024576414.1 s-adenosylmethionine mitochondrial carrier [Plasmopara halstedii]
MVNADDGPIVHGYFPALLGGAVAGTSVDIALFPLDTIKTRLQSAHGFLKAGGFRGIYSGLSAAAAGSAPGGALFFSTYETSKSLFSVITPDQKNSPLVHMVAAALGEMAACLVRTPTEVVKQKMQTGIYGSLPRALNVICAADGVAGFYRGYWSMIAREIPFSFIQFPLWEGLKYQWSKRQNTTVSSLQGAVCGSIAGDAKGVPYNGMLNTLSRVHTDEGLKRLFSGVGPRTMWISIGGFVFFGMYEKVTSTFAGFP